MSNEPRTVDVPDEFKDVTEACDQCPDVPGHEDCRELKAVGAIPHFDEAHPQLIYHCPHGHHWVSGTAHA